VLTATPTEYYWDATVTDEVITNAYIRRHTGDTAVNVTVASFGVQDISAAGLGGLTANVSTPVAVSAVSDGVSTLTEGFTATQKASDNNSLDVFIEANSSLIAPTNITVTLSATTFGADTSISKAVESVEVLGA
jgi:hypothetical protein